MVTCRSKAKNFEILKSEVLPDLSAQQAMLPQQPAMHEAAHPANISGDKALGAREKNYSLSDISMDSVPLANERIKLFRYSTSVVRDHSKFSQSIAASALGARLGDERTNYFQHNSYNSFHSQELKGIPNTVQVDPVDNADLRIVDLLDNGSTKPFLDFDKVSRSSSTGCAVHLFHELSTSTVKRNHFGVGHPDAGRISFSNKSNMKSIRTEILNDGYNYSNRLYVMPEREFEPLPDSQFETNPSVPVFIQEPSNRVPHELVNLICSKHTRMSY